MAVKLYTEAYIQNIANAIREKNGLTTRYKVGQMANAILNIPTGFDLLAMLAGSETFDANDETIPTESTVIPPYALSHCPNIRDINFQNVTSVAEHAFDTDQNIRNINLPNCTEIGLEAFLNIRNSGSAPQITMLNLPKVETIGSKAFYEANIYNSDLEINLPECTSVGRTAFGGYFSNFLMNVKTINLPKVVTIADYAFERATIVNVIIGDTCTNMGNACLNQATVTNLYVYATNPPTLGSSGLNTTPTHIYVPSGSVASYKAANKWSTYASIIEAIP